MRLTSAAFSEGERIPARYTCDDENQSPPLAWSGAPPQTMSFVVLCDDPDAPLGKWHHWAVFDIPPNRHALGAGLPASHETEDFKQAINDFRHSGYGGPCPPPSHGPHRYYFRLLALSVAELAVRRHPTCKDVEAEARRHVLAEAELCGMFGRKLD
jgi:Raf kinase inhibitor-like YbhB/YbcL family protein